MLATEPGVTPRWEWRTFAASLAHLEGLIGVGSPLSAREREEIYLLNALVPQSAKIRDGALDIKALLQVDTSGLELWKPVFKAAFPMPIASLRSAFSAWRLECPDLEREAYALDDFLTEVVRPDPSFRMVSVKKMRRRFSYRDCAAELVRVAVDRRVDESFCIEHERKDHVLLALSELGLDPRANINFPEWLARALGTRTPAASAEGT